MAGAWGVIASLVPAAELPALEIAVGCSLIEKCTDLRNEADALRDIVEDYAQQNARDAESEQARAQKRAQADRLGDGPEREMLERKVSMLLDYLGGAGSEPERRVAAYVRKTNAHHTDGLAELVCSNSFRSDDAETNAVGLLHAEMRRCGSLIMTAADAHRGAGPLRDHSGTGPQRAHWSSKLGGRGACNHVFGDPRE